MTDKPYVLAIDQGTTSSRAILFDHDGAIVASRPICGNEAKEVV